jgi:drug/metabolite transporter (DMT)-like permease
VTALATGLVLAAAGVHATWNLLAKRTGGGAAFIWMTCLASGLFYAPLAAALAWWQRPAIGPLHVLVMAGSAVLHTGYFLLLMRGYRAGDLSLVYPLARGTGPALATAAAVAFLGERPTTMALAGAALVVLGVFGLTGGPRIFARRHPAAGRAVAYGLATGLLIAGYTLWDKQAVAALLIPPVIMDWGANVGRVALLSPLAARGWDQVRLHWRVHRIETLGVGLLAPLSYILVLTAMVFTPVSYVAPAREVSILVAAVLGTRVLAEADGARRLAAAAAIAAGVVALALG